MTPGSGRMEEVRRREFPGAGDAIYLNAASFGLLPARSRAALDHWNEARASGRGPDPDEFGRALSDARSAAGRLLGVPPGEVALMPNTTLGIHLGVAAVAEGPSGTILVSDGEFPANVLPWRALERRGFRVEVVPADPMGRPDPERLAARMEAISDLRALALSMVQFGTGVALPLEMWGARCRAAGAFFAVDAIQGLGIRPLEDPASLGIDLVASGAQKWLLSPWGTGFAWLHPRHHSRVPPPVTSWWGFESSLDFEELLDYDSALLPDARRYEPATLPIQSMAAMARSLELILEVGVQRIREHVLELVDPLVEWASETPGVRPVSPEDPRDRGGMYVVEVSEPEAWARGLSEAGVSVSVRSGRIRFAPHLYNTSGELRQVVEVLDRIAFSVPG
ncbi:MAG: aminotransferase class V-fold PLP-dependent enzyme [Gemmatimonadales bacterium]|nr:MAG: aminotransferase class V-fold PLP-dependent enzyme [Gemmatimonadales bacterium]